MGGLASVVCHVKVTRYSWHIKHVEWNQLVWVFGYVLFGYSGSCFCLIEVWGKGSTFLLAFPRISFHASSPLCSFPPFSLLWIPFFPSYHPPSSLISAYPSILHRHSSLLASCDPFLTPSTRQYESTPRNPQSHPLTG